MDFVYNYKICGGNFNSPLGPRKYSHGNSIFRRKKVMAEKKKGGGALLGAALLMATSAIGP